MFNDLNYINTIASLLISKPAYITYGLIIFPIIVLLIYITLYKYLNLDLSSFSFLCFLINLLILLSYLFSIFLTYYFKRSFPIYMEDLSLYSKYRYLFFCITFVCCVIIYLLSYVFKTIQNKIDFFLFPHFNEEILKILKKKK